MKHELPVILFRFPCWSVISVLIFLLRVPSVFVVFVVSHAGGYGPSSEQDKHLVESKCERVGVREDVERVLTCRAVEVILDQTDRCSLVEKLVVVSWVSTNDSPYERRKTEDGEMEDGEMEDGEMEDGEMEDGEMEDGEMEDG